MGLGFDLGQPDGSHPLASCGVLLAPVLQVEDVDGDGVVVELLELVYLVDWHGEG